LVRVRVRVRVKVRVRVRVSSRVACGVARPMPAKPAASMPSATRRAGATAPRPQRAEPSSWPKRMAGLPRPLAEPALATTCAPPQGSAAAMRPGFS